MKIEKPGKINKLSILRAVASSSLVLGLGIAVIYSEFEQEQVWSMSLSVIAMATGLFIACLFSYLKSGPAHEHPGPFGLPPRHILSLQGLLTLVLFFLSAELAAILAALCIARLRDFYPLKLSLTVVFLAVAVFFISVKAQYGDIISSNEALIGSALMLSYYLFTLIITHNAAKERDLRKQAFDLNRELLATQELLAQSTRQSERLRIARDMHDLLGHQMTVLILNLEVITHLANGEILTKAEQSLALSKLLLGDLRNAVSDLRERNVLDFRQTLDRLIENTPELDVTSHLDEDLEIPDAKTADALIRCIQEALTNILRHANASRCHISLHKQEANIILRIDDNGKVRKPIAPGNGLNGMMERVKSLSGKLQWGEKQGSFFLEAELPGNASQENMPW